MRRPGSADINQSSLFQVHQAQSQLQEVLEELQVAHEFFAAFSRAYQSASVGSLHSDHSCLQTELDVSVQVYSQVSLSQTAF